MVSHRTCRISPPEAVLIHEFPPSRAPARLTQAAGAWKKNHGNNAAAQNGGLEIALVLFFFFREERRGAGAWGSMLPWNKIQIKTTSSEHNGQSWMLPHSYLSGNVKIQPNDFNALQTSRARKPFFFFFSRRIYIFPCKHCIIKARKATFQSSVLSFKRIPFTSSQCWHRRRSD